MKTNGCEKVGQVELGANEENWRFRVLEESVKVPSCPEVCPLLPLFSNFNSAAEPSSIF